MQTISVMLQQSQCNFLCKRQLRRKGSKYLKVANVLFTVKAHISITGSTILYTSVASEQPPQPTSSTFLAMLRKGALKRERKSLTVRRLRFWKSTVRHLLIQRASGDVESAVLLTAFKNYVASKRNYKCYIERAV